MNPALAIAISAIFFATIHGNLWQGISAFILGSFFGYAYYKTGSLKLTMLMHCVNNTLATLLSRIPGMGEAESFMDVLSPWAYWLEFIACAAIVVAAVAAISSIRIKDGEKSNCDRIKFE